MDLPQIHTFGKSSQVKTQEISKNIKNMKNIPYLIGLLDTEKKKIIQSAKKIKLNLDSMNDDLPILHRPTKISKFTNSDVPTYNLQK